MAIQAGAKTFLKQNADDIGEQFSLSETTSNSLGENLEKGIEKFLQARLESGKSYKAIKTEFQNSVKQLALTLSSTQRVLIIIDELDRCTPTFALQVLEATNHILNTDGLVFMFSYQKSQLEGMVEHTYGNSVDAAAYLQKFIYFNFKFPNIGVSTKQAANLKLATVELEKYSAQIEYSTNIRDSFRSLANDHSITPRLVQRIISLNLRIVKKADSNLLDRLSPEGVTRLILWKLTKPKEFNKLIQTETTPAERQILMDRLNYFYYFPRSPDSQREFFLTMLLLENLGQKRDHEYWFSKLTVFETL